MNMVNDPAGYGLGIPWHYIVGLIFVLLIVWVIMKYIRRKKNENE